jgi:hypothetical protein
LSEPVRATVIKLPTTENRDAETQTASPLTTTTTSTQVVGTDVREAQDDSQKT